MYKSNNEIQNPQVQSGAGNSITPIMKIEFNQQATDAFKIIKPNNSISCLWPSYIKPYLEQGANPDEIPLKEIEQSAMKIYNHLRITPTENLYEDVTSVRAESVLKELNEFKSAIAAYQSFYALMATPNEFLTQKIENASKLNIISSSEDNEYINFCILSKDSEQCLKQLQSYDIYQFECRAKLGQPFVIDAFMIRISKGLYAAQFNNFLNGLKIEKRSLPDLSRLFITDKSIFQPSATGFFSSTSNKGHELLQCAQEKLSHLPEISKITADPIGYVRVIFQSDADVTKHYNHWNKIKGVKKTCYPKHCIEISNECTKETINSMLEALKLIGSDQVTSECKKTGNY